MCALGRLEAFAATSATATITINVTPGPISVEAVAMVGSGENAEHPMGIRLDVSNDTHEPWTLSLTSSVTSAVAVGTPLDTDSSGARQDSPLFTGGRGSSLLLYGPTGRQSALDDLTVYDLSNWPLDVSARWKVTVGTGP